MNKKDFPLIVLQNLQNLKNQISDDISVHTDNSVLLKFVDKDPLSSFFFIIHSYEKSKDGYIYNIWRQPASEINNQDIKFASNYKNLINDFEIWKKLIKNYNDQIFFQDNFILNSYAKAFYDEYKLYEDDADTSPFDLKKQILIESYLEHSIKYLKKLESNKKQNYTDLITCATEIKHSQTK